jgi:hypothetical protein
VRGSLFVWRRKLAGQGEAAGEEDDGSEGLGEERFSP